VRVRATLSAGAVVVAALGSVSAPGAETSTSSGRHIDVSTRASVAHYLRSIHVKPARVVIQRGIRNYAGPQCPGRSWTCTSTRHPVVQVAPEGGKNVFRCSTRRCTVLQATASALATNVARCVRTTGITQSCSISQTSASANNEAIVVEIATKTTGLTQNASQAAKIVQQATGGASVDNGNIACVYQKLVVNTSTVATKGAPLTASLEGHQSVSVTQDSAYGDNVVESATAGGACSPDPLTQTQTIAQTATGSGSITQNENATAAGPNGSIDIEQNQTTPAASGSNTSAFKQTSNLTATAFTPKGPVSQTQSSPGGGLHAVVNQFSTGISTNSAKQVETQLEHAQRSSSDSSLPPNTTQTQYGPVRCCSVQGDNPANTFTIDQSSTQTNDTQQNQTNDVQAGCTTTGTCTATQKTTVDGDTTFNSQVGSDVSTQITCSGTDCTPTETNQTSISTTDVGEFGFGGMRGDGTGSIAVTGVTGTVTKALLFWNGPTNSTSPSANAAVTFNGTPVTGTNIGLASDNCWGFQNSQSYRADVTPLVSGNGTYTLSNFLKPDADVNGVTLIVFYNDGNPANDRNVMFWNGNDSNVASAYDPEGWDETLTSVPYPGAGSASLDFVVSDGQTYPDDALVLNGNTFVPAGPIFEGDSTPAGPFNFNGDLWDVKLFDMTSFLSGGANDLHLTTGLASDCLSLVVLLANVPASAPPPSIVSPSTALRQPSGSQFQAAPARGPRSARALPSRSRSRTRAGTESLPRRVFRSGGALFRRQGELQQDR
jgi:hypothetical protein